MDLQTRKLNVIEYVIGLKDEHLFQEIEDIIYKSMSAKKQAIKTFTHSELIERAKKANTDYIVGNVTNQEILETESDHW